jgi:hypothetical protein
MDQYHQNTCIRFVERNNEYDYVHISKADGYSELQILTIVFFLLKNNLILISTKKLVVIHMSEELVANNYYP